eukprot:6178290-Pleurochrysis_carterae.AAC.2
MARSHHAGKREQRTIDGCLRAMFRGTRRSRPVCMRCRARWAMRRRRSRVRLSERSAATAVQQPDAATERLSSGLRAVHTRILRRRLWTRRPCMQAEAAAREKLPRDCQSSGSNARQIKGTSRPVKTASPEASLADRYTHAHANTRRKRETE